MKKIILLLTASVQVGCVNTSRFVQSVDYSELNGEYYAYSEGREGERGQNISFFHGNYNDFPNSFTFEAQKDSLFISYFSSEDSIVKKRFPIKGKKKKRFIKNVVTREIIPFFPIFMRTDIDVVRFGKDKNDNLLIHRYFDRSGMLLFLAGGGGGQNYYVYKKLDQIRIKRPYFENGKYGILNENGEKITKPIFSSLSAFEKGIAKVEIDGKKGIIDENGVFLIPAQYDVLQKYSGNRPATYLASQNGKYGILSKEGKMLVPFEYDKIEVHQDEIYELSLGQKVGVYVPYEVHIPPIYSVYAGKASYRNFLLVFKEETPYMLDFDGNEYEAEIEKRSFFDWLDSPQYENRVYYEGKIYVPKSDTRKRILK